MKQKTIILTVRLTLPEDPATPNQKILTDRAEHTINEALAKSGIEGQVIGCDDEDTMPVEGLTIESMPTIADLLADDEDE